MLDASDAYNREVNYLSQMRYKHLPQLYAHFMDEQHWYIIIEYIDGQTLEEYMRKKRQRALPVRQVLDIGLDLCDTLRYLHMQRPPLIFRDVKPANIIRAHSGKLYLIDFGTTRPYRPGWKDTGPLGTPGYAAPEQYGSRAHTTPQTDIYGLGATLQTLLTGQEPLDILQHGMSPELTRRLPPELLDILARMQRRAATGRPRDMGEVRRVLQEIKDQFLSQKIKAAVLMGRDALKETSFFATLALTLLFFVDLASFTAMIWPGIWLLSLLAMAIFTGLKSVSRLREARDENQGVLNADEKVTIVWKQFAYSWSFALFVAFFIYYLTAFLALLQSAGGNFWDTDWVSSGVVVGLCLLVCLGWVGRYMLQFQARRRQVKQRQREMLIQQTMFRRP
jgi:serine/threonine protein kinase